MDASFNDYENFDEIRLPDEVIRERLIEDTRSEFQKQMDEAFYLSTQEFIKQDKINQEYEDVIIKSYFNEVSNRREIFKKLLTDIRKLIIFDKNIKEIYEIIEPIIDNYCQKYIEIWETDEETSKKIFKTLLSIRTDKVAIELLKTIIINN